ncbi:hypothetical protein [Cupriavidus plantarum]|uniref:hypothetical protein n=1 Tax=Cupriavidus plantarum TaxID=942865 RepID=UPI00339D44AE
MIHLQKERQDLALAQRHIAEGRARIRRQLSLIRKIRSEGHDPDQALQLLRLMRQCVEAQRMHKSVIVTIIRLGS